MDYNSLILNYLKGCATEADIRDLKTWLGESKENKRIFDEMSDIWNATATKNDNEFNVVNGFKKVKQHIIEENPASLSITGNNTLKHYRTYFGIASGIAAALLIGLILSLFFIRKSSDNQIANLSNAFTEISAPIGSKGKVVLPDGTKVWLNGGSTLRYNSTFNNSDRNIQLIGEAYFDVVKNTKVPFLVSAAEVTIKVLGTAFNIKAYPGEGSVETTLERGSLIVEQTSEKGEKIQTILAPKQRATFVKQTGRMLLSDTETQVLKKEKVHTVEMVKGKVLVAKEVDTEIFTAWKDNRLVFRNETFESLAIKLERWYGVTIIFANTEIKNLHFNGAIENETINDVLEIIRLTLPINYSVLHNNITITKQK